MIGDPSEVPGIPVDDVLGDVCADVPGGRLIVVFAGLAVVGGVMWMAVGYAALKLWEALT